MPTMLNRPAVWAGETREGEHVVILVAAGRRLMVAPEHVEAFITDIDAALARIDSKRAKATA